MRILQVTNIIRTKNGYNSDWIEMNNGFVVDYNNENLKDTVKLILLQDELRRKYSDNTIKTVMNCYSWERIIQLNEKPYSDVVGAYAS